MVLILSKSNTCHTEKGVSIREKVLNRIKELRKQHGLSQYQLAMLSGLSPSTINDIENGDKNPKQTTMMFIARAFNLKVTQVFILDTKYLD
jgi:DNA-binding XRE family transcriptional regulator